MSAAQILLGPPKSMLFTAKVTERDRVAELLDLGTTPDEVAQALELKRIWGVRNTSRFLNPVVRLIRQELPEASSIDVMERDRLRFALHSGWKDEVPLPRPVTDFLDAFNRGAYPSLELG